MSKQIRSKSNARLAAFRLGAATLSLVVFGGAAWFVSVGADVASRAGLGDSFLLNSSAFDGLGGSAEEDEHFGYLSGDGVRVSFEPEPARVHERFDVARDNPRPFDVVGVVGKDEAPAEFDVAREEEEAELEKIAQNWTAQDALAQGAVALAQDDVAPQGAEFGESSVASVSYEESWKEELEFPELELPKFGKVQGALAQVDAPTQNDVLTQENALAQSAVTREFRPLTKLNDRGAPTYVQPAETQFFQETKKQEERKIQPKASAKPQAVAVLKPLSSSGHTRGAAQSQGVVTFQTNVY